MSIVSVLLRSSSFRNSCPSQPDKVPQHTSIAYCKSAPVTTGKGTGLRLPFGTALTHILLFGLPFQIRTQPFGRISNSILTQAIAMIARSQADQAGGAQNHQVMMHGRSGHTELIGEFL